MDTIQLSVCLFLLISFIISTWKMYKRRWRLPPGPLPLPLLGNLLQGATKLYETHNKFSKQYGPVFTVWLGTSPVVALCGYDVVKDALIKCSQQFSFRGSIPISETLSKGYGIITTNGKRWHQMRKFTALTLRNSGMGKRSMEQRIQEEAVFLVQAISDKHGDAFDPHTLLGRSVNNVINLTVFGKRWQYEDEQFLKFLETTNNLFNFIRAPIGVAYSAFQKVMQYLPGSHQKIFQDCEHMKSLIQDQINSHRETLDEDSPRDYIDCFLIRANKEQWLQESEFCIENLISLVFELFMAGTETTANTLQFGLLVMIKFPHVQERVQKEIDSVIGTERLPKLADRIQMPYTNAVLHEILRFLDLVPLALPHVVMEDIFYRGFNIPRGTTIFPVLGSVLSDPACWETPDKFNPGHFLDHNGQFCMNDAFIPFSAGKRICPGEEVARIETFLFLTSLLQKFTFRAINHPDNIDLKTLRRAFRKHGLQYHLKAYPRTHATDIIHGNII
ncbi:cytochrome P450 2C16-like [Spea bombifrons]|uniref:cytochrome P450 2C16-like n=1 Tax=Spea bombifrons TaxID=233779 RepID=UPI00234BA39E|nr:cytochrome P450 2C16-like [Spea bombifrons]